ncbi:MAG: putative acetylornithine aminotransferase [Marine Group I thaumarchaeote]|nr:MAG: putative acetylornithine aminotransferase [Marine Group I thaumarchaeote]
MEKIPGTRAKKIIDTIRRNSYDSTYVYPLVVADGHDCVIKDVDGNEFLDFTSNVGASPLGYAHPDILKVRRKYAKNGIHKIAGQDFYCEEHAKLSTNLLSILPSNFKLFLSNSGAEAVENAIKLAYKKIGPLPAISCFNAFHGRTLGALTFTYSKPEQKQNFPEFKVKRIKFCTKEDDREIDAAEKLLKKNKMAFIITEIIQGEGGYRVASKRFIKTLRKLATRYSVPLIFDEVQSGLGQTGRWWAFEHYDVKPDITSIAKALQVGCTAYHKRYDPGQRGVLSSTWGGGDRISMATGARIIEVIKRDRLLDNVRKRGRELKKGLLELVGKHGIEEARGLGLMIGLECNTTKRRDEIVRKLFKKKLLILGAGKKSIRFIPPLILSKKQVERGLEILQEVLSRN